MRLDKFAKGRVEINGLAYLEMPAKLFRGRSSPLYVSPAARLKRFDLVGASFQEEDFMPPWAVLKSLGEKYPELGLEEERLITNSEWTDLQRTGQLRRLTDGSVGAVFIDLVVDFSGKYPEICEGVEMGRDGDTYRIKPGTGRKKTAKWLPKVKDDATYNITELDEETMLPVNLQPLYFWGVGGEGGRSQYEVDAILRSGYRLQEPVREYRAIQTGVRVLMRNTSGNVWLTKSPYDENPRYGDLLSRDASFMLVRDTSNQKNTPRKTTTVTIR
ncbi:MAG: hypothetical protein HY515_03730 [Candidatus Aenigmarchaeota archaeon]|nr:hypothetical protein [Candidatus Aenigmarchaeota archaeon]